MHKHTQDIFELTLARPVATATGEHPHLVHLWWRAPAQGSWLVQVYINDQLHDVTSHSTQRDMWLTLDRTQPHRIELLAVDPCYAWQNLAHVLSSWSPAVRDVAAVAILRDEELPTDTQISVSINGKQIANEPMWPANTHRNGFGGLFGIGGFGIDDATGPGLGLGELGMGTLGADGSAWHWRHHRLPAGEYTLSITATTADGQPIAASTAHDVTIDQLPEPARDLTLDADFTLRWR